MHAYCADPAGNAIPMLSPAEEAYGALASKEGVILSVEKIVTTDYLRKHSLCVRVPASIVKCVVEVPFGMHPLGCRGHDGDGYGEDAEFGRRLQEAFREKETTEAWLKEWILDVKSHEGYLRKLGSERLHTLRGRISYDSWKADALKMVESLSDAPPNRSERAAYFAVCEIVDSVEKRGYNTILAGIGISHLASWVAAYKLRDEGVPINLVVELGAFGYLPPPGQSFLVSARGMGSCPMLTDTLGILGFIENSTRMFASVSAGQVDRYGNVNSTKVDDFFLFGSGGANDVSVKAKEIVVTVLHDRRRLVEKVPYVTWLGDNVRKVVTDRAVFEKVDGELVLKKVYVREGESEKAAVDAVVRGMGWKPRMAEKLARLGEPGREEILMLRCFDPDRYFLGRLEEK
jgi:acyl CoA:acetate/3-ketoacid CoA transferase beta subunit